MANNNRLNVVFADDSKIHHLLFKASLARSLRFNLLHCANNGQEIVQFMLYTAIKPDICVLDLHMPLMSGIQVCELIHQTDPDIALVGFTSSSDEDEKQAMLSAGAQRVFSKEDLASLVDYLHTLERK